MTTYNVSLGVPINFTITGTLGGQPISGTVSGGPTALITGTNNVVIEALTGLNNFQDIVLSGTNNVLNANYSPVPASNYLQTGLNLVNIQTWNINISGPYAGESYGVVPPVVSFSGDAAVGNVIKNLTTVNLNDNSGTGTLLIGDNSEPVQETNGANGFTITAANAVGYNSLNFGAGPSPSSTASRWTSPPRPSPARTRSTSPPTSSAASASSTAATSFRRRSSSQTTTATTTTRIGSAISATPFRSRRRFGSSLTTLNGVTLPPTGAVGFQTWDISSIGAKSVGTVNILALGNEGSWNATTINLTDDGSTTILFASALATACRRTGRTSPPSTSPARRAMS